MSLNGVINFYKPPGMTSAQAVAFVKRLTRAKTGHAGTLDPEAAGVLPILIGRATRINDYLMDLPKVYLAEIAFGASTDTQDAQGRLTATGGQIPTLEALKNAAQAFVGETSQLPPQYSALKVGGQTAYQLARAGKTAPLEARVIAIDALDVLGAMPRHGFLMRVRCSKGTYIRTLCHDLGQDLDCPAHMRFLLREESSGLKLTKAVTMAELTRWAEAGFPADQAVLLPIQEALHFLPRVSIPESWLFPAINGVKIPLDRLENPEELKEQTKVCLYCGDALIGIYERQEEVLKVAVMLHLP